MLDVGCGTGSALRHASEKVTRGRLIGVDPIPRMVEIARERLVGHPAADRVELYVAPAHALPVGDATVHVVLALDSYDHWGAERLEGLREVRRVLVSGGRFVVVKDAGVPLAADAKRQWLEDLRATGFTVESEQHTKTPEVAFTTWVCSVDAHA
ncbi:MAG: methyltransferase domain-containing protein [Myxococcota bacterium]